MNHKNIKIDPSIIEKIIKYHNLGKITSLHYNEQGEVNPCVFINNTYVLRLNIRDKNIKKFFREKEVITCLQHGNIPCSNIVAYGEGGQVCEYEYLITSKLPGEDLLNVWDKLGVIEKRRFIYKMGEALANLHSIPVKNFSTVFNTFTNWYEMCCEMVKLRIDNCMRVNLLDLREKDIIMNFIFQNNDILSTVSTPSIVHYDYNKSNILVSSGEISGVIDFEWSIFGDPEFDFHVLEKEFSPNYRDLFLEGYTIKKALSNEFAKKLQIYKLIYQLELIPVLNAFYGKEASMAAKKNVLEIIDNYKNINEFV